METAVTKKEKILAAVAYVPFPPLFLVPLLMGRHDSFIEFHGKQGLVVFLAWFVLWIIGLIPIIAIVGYIGFVALIVMAIVAIVRTCMGQRWELPLLGRWAKKLKL
jgi:Chloroplast import component protein (Tic20).